MIRLGHIEYSNCIPVHALLLQEPQPGIELVRDVPSRLNAALASGAVDVAPCSSIEYARHAADYRILPHHAIGSAGPVQSILLESTVPLHRLHGAVVAVPDASATSVVLLRILLQQHWRVPARFISFEQANEDPFANGASAALWIGDVALRRQPRPGHLTWDLGEEWLRWSGLPFAFALWQVRRDLPDAERQRLAALLHDSRAWFLARQEQLAREYSPRFGVAADRLLRYWDSLVYDFDADIERGLLRFLDLAADLGEAPRVAAIQKAPAGRD